MPALAQCFDLNVESLGFKKGFQIFPIARQNVLSS
jgi:hypothetical protein